MSLSQPLLVVIVVMIGAAVPVQAGLNALMARHAGHPLLGGITNTIVATLVLLAFISLFRLFAPLTDPARTDTLANAPWWVWCGGILGATFVFSALFFAPRMGAAAYVSASIVGTMTASLLIDHYGLLAFEARPIEAMRIVGAVLVVVGMALIQWYR
jgi:transporter family-2 protein